VPVLGQSGEGSIAVPRTGSFLVSSDGPHAIECKATDGMTPAHTDASPTYKNTASFKIDATPPTVTCGPTPVFVLNGPGGQVSATVTDSVSGPVAASVSGPADVSTAGPKTVLLTGNDNAGNSKTVACPYIVAYDILGFFSPLPKSIAQAGSTIPVKFALADANGVLISDAQAQGLAAACEVTVTFTGGTPSPNCFAYDATANQFVFMLKTPKSVTGPQTITMNVTIGAVVVNTTSSTLTLK
jgi:hypothetical protein